MAVRQQRQFREMSPREFLHETYRDARDAFMDAPSHQRDEWWNYRVQVHQLLSETPE